MLAGEEFVIRYGVRGPLAALDDRSHIELRQGLIRTLRILVPAIFLPAFAVAITVGVLDGSAFQWAGAVALFAWLLVTLFGTVPINEAAIEWSADAPPANWKALVDRWERLNTVRTWTAMTAFACLLTSVALRI
jgi:uncharacterized membrane protein